MSKRIFLLAFFSLLVLTSACKGGLTTPPTTDPGQIATQVAAEVAAQLTEIALSQPSATVPAAPAITETELPLPSETPLPPTEAAPTAEAASATPQPTPTHTVPPATSTWMPTATATTAPFACQITKQVPANGKSFEPGADFDTTWTVKNTGTATWDSNEVDYRYDKGDKLHQTGVYDLPKTVKPGESVALVVDMTAPDEQGEYDTTWVLRRGGLLLCTLTVEIEVKE
jgi:hypothetical protein